MLRRKLSLLPIAALCGIAIYINALYICSPFSLKKSEVTLLTWKDTKRPIQVEYLTIDMPNNWTLNKISKDSEEIRYIIKAFEHIIFLTDSVSDISSLSLHRESSRGKEILVTFRHTPKFPDPKNLEGTILFQFRFYENDDYGTTNKLNYFRIPQELKEHILLQNKKF